MKLMLNAETRTLTGTRHSRRLRRTKDAIPGVIYGGDKEPDQVIFSRREIVKLMEQETFFSHAVTIQQKDRKEEAAVLRDLQRHPAKGNVMHLDFMRIRADRAINVRVPLHFINEDKCIGVKTQGGNISHSMTEVEVSCLPDIIPDAIIADLLNLNVREALHLSDLDFPEGVSSVALRYGADHDLPVASVQPPRGGLDIEDEETEETETAETDTVEQESDK